MAIGCCDGVRELSKWTCSFTRPTRCLSPHQDRGPRGGPAGRPRRVPCLCEAAWQVFELVLGTMCGIHLAAT